MYSKILTSSMEVAGSSTCTLYIVHRTTAHVLLSVDCCVLPTGNLETKERSDKKYCVNYMAYA